MQARDLRSRQAPLKAQYREQPSSAVITMHAVGQLIPSRVSCQVETATAPIEAGLHRAAGGDGDLACSGDMLLQALVACAGVTLNAVATALELPIRSGVIRAEGDLDFRGTLGVDRAAPVGFTDIRLEFTLDTDGSDAQIERLLDLTERYCVIFQTLKHPATTHVTYRRPPASDPT